MSGARIWPRQLPQQTRSDPHRQAEVRVYDLLAEALGDPWVIFYSRPWLGLTPFGEEKDGEADFVIIHPERGCLTIEVKGGAISYDPQTNQWRSCDRNNIRHLIKDPVEQARTSHHILLKKVREQPGWPTKRFVRFHHGVIFTDTDSPPHALGPDKPRELFCCRKELQNIGKWVRQRLSGNDAAPMGTSGVAAFEKLLAAPFQLSVPLGHYFDDDDKVIQTLTPQQFHILEAVAHLPRVAAGGGAGTGKTILACEDAIRMSRDGLRTALICLSPHLAANLSLRLKDTSVEVWCFPKLCTHLAFKAGLIPSHTASLDAEVGAELIAKAAHNRPDLRFNAIIVDEAQDFPSHWWIALTELLHISERMHLHVFFDTNQSVYGDISSELASFNIVPIRLTRNLRNTQAIHSAASHFYRGTPITADGPKGSEIEWIECTTANLVSRVREIIMRLTSHDEINPEQIAVLGANNHLIEELRKTLAAFEGLAVEEIRDFKGLEKQVIVIAASKEIADFPEMAYVALSRPRVHLVCVGETHILLWLKNNPS